MTLFYTAHRLKPLSFKTDKLNAELSKIEHWLSFNSLFVNVTKTEAMLSKLPLDYQPYYDENRTFPI